MAIRGRHPSAKPAPFAVGDVVHHPEHGPVTVESMGNRYFTGRTASGEELGQTSIGLARGENMSGEAKPWRVQTRESRLRRPYDPGPSEYSTGTSLVHRYDDL